MTSVRIEWNGPKALEAVAEATDIGLGAAANVIASEMTARMGTEGGGVAGLQRGQINRMGGRAKYYAAPAGAFPGVRTGRLRRSMEAVRVKRGQWRAGTNLDYGRYLESGTRRMRARPWAVRSAELAEKKAVRAMRRTFRRELRNRLRRLN